MKRIFCINCEFVTIWLYRKVYYYQTKLTKHVLTWLFTKIISSKKYSHDKLGFKNSQRT